MTCRFYLYHFCNKWNECLKNHKHVVNPDIEIWNVCINMALHLYLPFIRRVMFCASWSTSTFLFLRLCTSFFSMLNKSSTSGSSSSEEPPKKKYNINAINWARKWPYGSWYRKTLIIQFYLRFNWPPKAFWQVEAVGRSNFLYRL